jgi:hypothetical protein
MRFLSKTFICAFSITLVLFWSACKKETKTSWDTEMLVPIATTSLSIQNLVKDSSIVANSDNSLRLAYNNTLYEFSLAKQVINIPDTSIGQRFSLNELKLPNQKFNHRMSLGFLAHNMTLSPDGGVQFLGNFLIGQNGTSIPVPAVNGLAPGAPFNFDASAFFDSAYLSGGEIQIWAVNNMPIPLTNIVCQLKNHIDNTVITTETIPNIPANDSVYFTVQMAGKKLTNSIDFYITSLSTPGSNGVSVPIDTANYLELRMFVFQMTASEAWARFPTQNVVDQREEVTQVIGDRKFTYVDAREGQIHVFVTSSVEEQLYLKYTLEGAYDRNGNPITISTVVPPAPSGGQSTIDRLIDISGVAINLTGKDGSKFNTYTQHIEARMDSSGLTRHVTAADSLNFRYEIKNIKPNYIKGYAGRDTILLTDTSDFAFLDIFKGGTLDLEEVNMNFEIENGIGIDGEVKINNLVATSPINGSKTLTGSVLGQPFNVVRGVDFPLVPGVSSFPVNATNSNIKELIGILPNQLQYDVEVKTNLNGNNGQYRDFAYLESALKIKLNADIPLSLIANQLLLLDTIDFDLSNTNTNIEGISDGVINVIAQNKYPIEANLTMIIYDENWIAVDSLLAGEMIAAASLNSNCKAEASMRSKIPLYVDEARMENIKRGKRAVIKADFSTTSVPSCNGGYVKIYSDYKLDITFTAQFNYKVGFKF